MYTYAHTHTHTHTHTHALQSVSIECSGQVYTSSEEPLTFSLPPPAPSSHVTVTLSFHGHYGEPPLQLQYLPVPGHQIYCLSYHIQEGVWHIETQ